MLGTSQSYGVVTAYGFAGLSSSVATNLFGKNDAGAEKGVGIAANSDHEINKTSYIQLDVSALMNPFSLSIGSTQDQEGFSIFGSSTLGVLGTKLQDYSTPSTDPFNTGLISKGAFQFISVTADGNPGGAGNVLLDSLTYTAATPEPNSLMLLGTGVVGAGGLLRRKLFR